MGTYRSKIAMVEALQITKDNVNDESLWTYWMFDALKLSPGSKGAIWPSGFVEKDGKERFFVSNRDGTHIIEWGDYIVRVAKDEIYSIKPYVFEAIYVPVEEIVDKGKLGGNL